MINLIFDKNYKQENTKYFVVHHFGGVGNDNFASTQKHSLNDIDSAHGARWPGFYSQILNLSTGRGFLVGYNGIIFPDRFVQTRAIGEETAAQMGYNFNGVAVSFCVAGNFTKRSNGTLVDTPTQFQIDCLRELRAKFPQVSTWNVVPHRMLGTTNCYGTGLPDDWARKITQAQETPIAPSAPDITATTMDNMKIKLSIMQQILALIAKIADIRRINKLGRTENHDENVRG